MSQQINLFSASLRAPHPVLSATRVAILVGVLIISMFGYRSYLVGELGQTEAALAQVNARLTGLQEQTAKFGRIAAQGVDKALEDSIARTQAQLEIRQALLDRLKGGGLGNTKGFSDYLTALARQRAEGVWITGLVVSGAGTDVEIQGGITRPEMLPEYVRRLSREEVMRGRQIDELRMARKETEPRVQKTAAAAAPEKSAQTATDGAGAGERAPTKLRYVEFSIVSGASRSRTGG